MLHYDPSNIWKASASVLPKNLCGLGFRFTFKNTNQKECLPSIINTLNLEPKKAFSKMGLIIRRLTTQYI